MFEFVVPKINYFGENSIESLKTILNNKELKKGLIITDNVLDRLGYTSVIKDILSEVNVGVGIFNEVEPNPSKEMVYKALNCYKEGNCDFIIGLGGGSPNDVSKAVSVLATNNVKLEDLVGPNKSELKGAYLILINTTAGTASEISRAYLISDNENQEKLIMKDIHALADVSINDTNLMLKLPPNITAATGMDALTHALEAYVSNGSYNLTREMAISAIYLIFNNLENAVKDGNDIEARNNMIYAQTLAGMAFCNSGVGLVHAMSHQLSSVFNLPHGLSNAILLPYVMKENAKYVQVDYSQIAKRVFYVNEENCNYEYLINQVNSLSEKIGTKLKLSDLGVKEEDLELLAEKTLRDGNIYRNPFMPTMEEVVSIFENAL